MQQMEWQMEQMEQMHGRARLGFYFLAQHGRRVTEQPRTAFEMCQCRDSEALYSERIFCSSVD
jgi:hypothetical protein